MLVAAEDRLSCIQGYAQEGWHESQRSCWGSGRDSWPQRKIEHALWGKHFVRLCTLVVRPAARKCAFTAIKRSLPEINIIIMTLWYSHAPTPLIVVAIIPIPCSFWNVLPHILHPPWWNSMADRCRGDGFLQDLGPVLVSFDSSAIFWPRSTKSSSSLVSAKHTLLPVVLVMYPTEQCRAWLPFRSLTATALLQEPSEVWIRVLLID